MSLESQFGWHDLYSAMEAWPERIIQTINAGHRDRDEMDFYLCFFVQCWSLTDWAKENKLISNDLMQSYIDSYECMGLCRDIATRYKHLTIKSLPKCDLNWSFWVGSERGQQIWMVTAAGKDRQVWDLMMECIDFWLAINAYHDFDSRRAIFRPQ